MRRHSRTAFRITRPHYNNAHRFDRLVERIRVYAVPKYEP